jgi:hypothetical protein
MAKISSTIFNKSGIEENITPFLILKEMLSDIPHSE